MFQSMIDKVRLLIVSVALVVRWGVSLWPHSGQHSPPMFGDYEAQRHWQEITVNVDMRDWYENTTDNDLLYWGLDYPPLTAYHSYVLGLTAQRVNSSWVELGTSRGLETPDHRLFMRLSVVLADLMVLFPAVFLFSSPHYLTVVTLLAYPGLSIIDHGHFQYNNISLGLFLAAVSYVTSGYHALGSVFFVCALNYKQMELYHALPFFFYLLGVCHQQRLPSQKISKLLTIGVSVIATFAIIWSPFIMFGQDSVIQVIKRIFPFGRGLFEDKVANFWCAVDVVLKLKKTMTIPDLAKLCLISTFTLSVPSNIHLLFSPTQRNFLLSLVNTSLTFFLFSFQVHEKSILLAAVPVCLLTYSTELDPIITKTIVPWFLTITSFSMLPLLSYEGLLIPTVALTVLYLALVHDYDHLVTLGQDRSVSLRTMSPAPPAPLPPVSTLNTVIRTLAHISLLGSALLTTLSQLIPAPDQYPFLWPLIISVYSAAHFMLALIYFHIVQFTSPEINRVKLKQKKNK